MLNANLSTFGHRSEILCKSLKLQRKAAVVVFMPWYTVPDKDSLKPCTGQVGRRALSSGNCHDRGVELPYRCNLQGATVVVKIFKGHPENVDWQS